MWADKIDESAVLLASTLQPGAIDRGTVMPVAAVAIWSLSRGAVALVGQNRESGQMFPVGQKELPLLEADVSEITEKIASFLAPLVVALRIPAHRIVKISGLLANREPVSSLINGGLAQGTLRSLKLLPFRIDIEGAPQLLGSWHPPTEASRQIRARKAAYERSAGAIILNRSLSGNRLEGFAASR